MANQKEIIGRLMVFREIEKFSNEAWKERGLNPSPADLCAKLEGLFNNCADRLITAIESGLTPAKLKAILTTEFANFKKSDYDTEESEFICDYFFQLSAMISVDFNDNITEWIYGKDFADVYKQAILKNSGKIEETLSQDCTRCGSKLESFIIRKQEGIPEYGWRIIQCNNCKELNLAWAGPNIKELRFGNYTVIEHPQNPKFTKEQAIARLEQLRNNKK